MKQTLPVKRRPVVKGLLKRLSAVTGNRKQRVAASGTLPEMENDESSSKISRALTIIFLIHIVAIGLIFVHQKYLDGRTDSAPLAAETQPAAVVPAPAPRRADAPRLSTGEKPYFVQAGDNFAIIATKQEVDESSLRQANIGVEIGPGVLLRIPPKRIVALDPPEVTALRTAAPVASGNGLVEALPIDVRGAPRAQLVRPNIAAAATATAPAASGKTYVVQSGDSVWRIANKFGISQESLMKANGITDARKMKIGMKLNLPR